MAGRWLRPVRVSGCRAMKTIRTARLEIAYEESGQAAGRPVILLHGFPTTCTLMMGLRLPSRRWAGACSCPIFAGTAPPGFSMPGRRDRVNRRRSAAISPISWTRGLERAVLAGYDWGGRAACVVAALWPDRCTALVSVNSYLIQDIAAADTPLPPDLEAGLWYFFYFLTERGRAGLTATRVEIARVIWT